MTSPEPISRGRRPMLVFAALGVAGTVAALAGTLLDARGGLYGYLIGFVYWAGIAVSALILLMSFHASNARWPTVIRRPLENVSLTIAVLVPLFVPIVIGAKQVFVWASPDAYPLTEHMRHAIEHKRLYLNIPFFLVRAVIYFASWVLISWLLRRWSLAQDARPGDLELTRKQRRLSAGGLPLLALTLTFAAFDWLMSLEPDYYSTLFGAYFFSGAFVAAIALVTLITQVAAGPELASAFVNDSHRRNLGNLLLAFSAFWAYLAYSQYMLTWIANIPDEVPWFLTRTHEVWRPIAVILFVGHFVVPFFALLSLRAKVSRLFLVAISLWILFFHFVDVHWMVLPARLPEYPWPTWVELASLVGIGGIAAAFGIFLARGHRAIPVGDPYLAQSLEYHQP